MAIIDMAIIDSGIIDSGIIVGIIGGGIFRDNVGAWLAAALVALLTVFSDKLLERIRFRLNRADLRAKYFEELAVDLSTHIFFAEIFCERYQKGWAGDAEDMASLGGEVNGAVTTLRKKEFVYRSWVHRYWGDKTVAQFAEVMAAVKAVHASEPSQENPHTGILRSSSPRSHCPSPAGVSPVCIVCGDTVPIPKFRRHS